MNNLKSSDQTARKGDEAITTYRRAIGLTPNAFGTHNSLGRVLQRQGKLDAAVAAYQEALRLKPDYVMAHFGPASALAQSKQWDRSATVCEKALERLGTPLWPGPWYEAIRSEELFTRLTAPRPDDHLPWIMRARLHVLERDWKRAAADYARVNELLASIDQAKLLRM